VKGRKPIPTALKVLRGNPGKRALPPEPTLPPASPSLPRELAGDPVARAEWKRLEPMLRDAKVLTDGDRAALIAVCQQWSRYVDASAHVRLEGLVQKAPESGYPMANPYLPIANKALALCVRLWVELGLTPSARTRVGLVHDGGPAAELEAFLHS
jgi:P27 family predicted phage terminase small subunit